MAQLERPTVNIGHLRMRSPLLTASGTSGSSSEIERLRESGKAIKALGAFVTKGVTLESRTGNPELRVVETRTGLLNSIGLQNPGAEHFTKNALPSLLRLELPVIVNISASTIDEFKQLAAFLMDNDENEIISGLEINVSCPNIGEGGLAFGTTPRLVERIVRAVKEVARKRVVVITKLTPNVTDITLPAKAAIAGGTDALSMINTLRGMAINVADGKPFLGNVVGGLSGPAIKPVGVFMVYDCFGRIPECRDRRIPIIGIGGISDWRDALEYVMAGATAVGIGTAWFVNPSVFDEVKVGIEKFLDANDRTLSELVGMSHDQ